VVPDSLPFAMRDPSFLLRLREKRLTLLELSRTTKKRKEDTKKKKKKKKKTTNKEPEYLSLMNQEARLRLESLPPSLRKELGF
jgi:hypothetical protein